MKSNFWYYLPSVERYIPKTFFYFLYSQYLHRITPKLLMQSQPLLTLPSFAFPIFWCLLKYLRKVLCFESFVEQMITVFLYSFCNFLLWLYFPCPVALNVWESSLNLYHHCSLCWKNEPQTH